jgi:N6-adenosine-specific RNA methylase IME4
MLDFREIPLTAIDPSPYQVRKDFNPVKLQEFANNLARDGQIHAILVRPKLNRFELVCGERHWRATQLIKGATTIRAEVREMGDLQARRLTAAENMQREDLSPIEWIGAIADMVDAELIEDAEYAALAETPQLRVRTLLGKLDSDRRRGADHVSHTFVGQVESVFAQLPKPVAWRSYLEHDLPVLKLPDEVQQLAITEKLSKSQIEALGQLHRHAPGTFREVVQQRGVRPQWDLHERGAKADDIRPLAEVSAREIRLMASRRAQRRQERQAAVATAVYTTSVETDLLRLIDEGKRFATIYADPPWPYKNQATRGATGNHYATLSLKALAALPVPELVTQNAHLHLWATNAFLDEAIALLRAWGFAYRTYAVWDKLLMGAGNYWRNQTELLLFGVRGRLLFRDRSLRNVIREKRGRHSAKPEVVRALIERASPGPYLELFGRRVIPGWTVVGNQIEGTW